MSDTALGRALARLADVGVIGLLAAVASLGIVTLPSALAAGATALRAEGLGAGIRVFWPAFGRALRAGWAAGAALAVLVVLGAADVALVGPSLGGGAGSVVAGLGIVLVLLGAGPVLAVAAALRADAIRVRDLPRTTLAVVALAPASLLWSALLAGAVLTAILTLPIAVVPLAGVGALLVQRVDARLELRVAAAH